MPEPSPTFSVVIALHNKAEYVRDALASVQAQTLPPLEILVVDDGSTDGSAEAVEALDWQGLTLIRQDQQGPGPARNRAMAMARGRYCAFLDADDLWLPGHLDALARTASAFPNAALIGTDFNEFSGPPPLIEEAGAVNPRLFNYFAEQVERTRLWTGSAAVLTEVARRHGGFGDFCPGEDRWLWQSLALAEPVAVLDRVTALYRRQTGGVMEQVQQGGGEAVALPPTMRQLDDHLANANAAGDLSAIRQYRHHLWNVSLRQYVYRGKIAGARRIARQMGDRGLAVPRELGLILALPSPISQALLALYRARPQRHLFKSR